MNKSFAFLFHKKIFWKFFISYIIIFFIPFSSILFTYTTAQKTIRNEIMNSSSNSLYQFFSVVDSSLAEMAQINISLLNSSLTKQYSYHTREELAYPLFDSYELKEFLKPFKQGNIDDIFLYYPHLEKIAALNGCLDSTTFYEAYYKDMLTRERFSDLLSTPYRSLKPTLLSLNSDIRNAALAVLVSQKYPGGEEMLSLVSFNKNSLKKLFQSADFHSKSTLMIFDNQNKLLASSQDINTEFNLSGYGGGNTLYYDTFGAQDYVIQVFTSRVADCVYVSATPSSAFWSKLTHIRFIVIVSSLFCMIFSFITAYFLAKQNYSPITSILHTISNKTVYVNNKQDNEMVFINNVLKNCLEEIHQLNNRLGTKEARERQDFLLHALQDSYPPNDPSLDDIFLRHHISLLSDRFGVLLIQIEEIDRHKIPYTQDESPALLSFILTNVSQELCASKHQGFLVDIAPMQYACIVNFNRDCELEDGLSYINFIAGECSMFIQKHYGIYTTMSISNIHSGLSDIHTAYKEALHTLKYRFQYGKNSIMSYSLIQNKTFHYNNSTDSKSAQIIMAYIKRGNDCNFGKEVVDEVLALANIQENSALESLEFFRYDTVNSLSKIIFESNFKQLEEKNHFTKQLLKAESFQEFLETLTKTLDILRNYNDTVKISNTICDKAAALIESNYMDYNVNNTTIGETLDISPSYLSQMFREQKSITLMEYLYKIRIKKAKELLSNNCLTLEVVAAKTGFSSSSTLIKVFKKSEGITPGAYRKLIQP
jgi:AraC-like DNA-binding protein